LKKEKNAYGRKKRNPSLESVLAVV
jgi:hypothetical protein